MSWVRDVLSGKKDLPLGPNDRSVLDALFARWWGGAAAREQLTTGFRGLLTDPSARLRSAAVLFFVRHSADDEGALVDALLNHVELFDGVRQTWQPGEGDLRALLAAAVSQRARASESALTAVRREAMRPGHGQRVIVGLLASDPSSDLRGT